MTEKRFVYYEHKGADYILEEPNTELDFIEMLGDTLDAEEITDRLNELYNENEQLKQENQELRHFKLSIKSFAECNDNINRRTLNDLIGGIDYD